MGPGVETVAVEAMDSYYAGERLVGYETDKKRRGGEGNGELLDFDGDGGRGTVEFLEAK